MKKYVLCKDSVEVKRLKDIYYGCVLNKASSEPLEIKTFDNLDEAIKEIDNYDTSVTDYGRYYLVEEYFIEEREQDEDGEFMYIGVHEYSKLPDQYSQFYINDKSHHGGFDRTKYNFDEVKEYFKHSTSLLEDDEDIDYLESLNEEIEQAEDIKELIEILVNQNGGIELSYVIEEVK